MREEETGWTRGKIETKMAVLEDESENQQVHIIDG
jgi:hypothetical protein